MKAEFRGAATVVAITLVPSYVCGRSIITCARRILMWPAQGAALVHDSSWVRPMPIMPANSSWGLTVGPRLSIVHSALAESSGV